MINSQENTSDFEGTVNSVESAVEKIPHTRFEQVDIDKETKLLNHFMEGDRWAEVFVKRYPELKLIQAECIDEKERMIRHKQFLESVHAREEVQISNSLEQLRLEWEKIGKEFLETLASYFETSWPEGKDITGYVSVLPVFPRFLDSQEFFTGYKDVGNNIEISAHEIVHFLWFKKWKEVFPESQRNEYETPHLVWRLSEIMDPIILQCHPKIKELIKPKMWGYNSFKDIKIGDVNMTDYFKKVYLNSVQAGDSFDLTLKKLLVEAQNHEEEISVF